MSISKEGYSTWLPDSSFSQTAVFSSAKQRQSVGLSKLELLLIRTANKIEERTHNPYWMLQRSYSFDKKYGITSHAELAKALEYFKILLSSEEVAMLYDAFSSDGEGKFDFKAFARALYPKESSSVSESDNKKQHQQQQEESKQQDSYSNTSSHSPFSGTSSEFTVVSSNTGVIPQNTLNSLLSATASQTAGLRRSQLKESTAQRIFGDPFVLTNASSASNTQRTSSAGDSSPSNAMRHSPLLSNAAVASLSSAGAGTVKNSKSTSRSTVKAQNTSRTQRTRIDFTHNSTYSRYDVRQPVDPTKQYTHTVR